MISVAPTIVSFFEHRPILRTPVGATWTDKADHLIRCSLSLRSTVAGQQNTIYVPYSMAAPGSQILSVICCRCNADNSKPSRMVLEEGVQSHRPILRNRCTVISDVVPRLLTDGIIHSIATPGTDAQVGTKAGRAPPWPRR